MSNTKLIYSSYMNYIINKLQKKFKEELNVWLWF